MVTDINVYKALDELDSLPEDAGTHLTLGVFDGIHLGHQALIKRTVESAHKTRALPAVFTFTRHPLSILAPPYTPRLLTPLDVREGIFASMGIKILVIVDFDSGLSSLTPEEFVRNLLVKRLRARHVICGFNFRFGAGGRGDASRLREIGEKSGFTVEIVKPVLVGGIIVSSTKIRELLNQGMVALASEFLGRHHSVRGEVERGAGRGRSLGYPTANLLISPDILIPARGVYAVKAVVGGKRYGGMMNIGINPTFASGRFSAEVHLFGLEQDLIGKSLEVQFIERLRDEKRFANETALMHHLRRDEQEARKILSDA